MGKHTQTVKHNTKLRPTENVMRKCGGVLSQQDTNDTQKTARCTLWVDTHRGSCWQVAAQAQGSRDAHLQLHMGRHHTLPSLAKCCSFAPLVQCLQRRRENNAADGKQEMFILQYQKAHCLFQLNERLDSLL